jgi:hypothetical protein
MIENFEYWMNENQGKPLSSYISENRLPSKMKDFLSEGKNAKEKIFKIAMDKYKKQFQVPNRGFIYRARYQEMENRLIDDMKARRTRGARVSSFWIKHRAKALVAEMHPNQLFSASNGWLFRFMRRRNIKFRKTINVKAQSAEDKRDKIVAWHQRIRNEVLPYCDTHVGAFHPYYGRFAPEKRYNMDQIPMPFVVEQGSTFTFEDDDHVHIKGAGAEGLVKRQFTAHVFINAGKDASSAKGYVDMICRGTGKRISLLEKESYDPRVHVRFQPKA